jgi:uncharacterized membrane protein
MSMHVMLRQFAARPIQFVMVLAVLVLPLTHLAYADSPFARNRILPADCWEIHSLGTLGGLSSAAQDINDAGQVIGDALTEPRILDIADPPLSLPRSFISAPNGGALTEIVTGGYYFGSARAINRAGQVVGLTTAGRSFQISFVTDPGGGNARETLGYGHAVDINNVGKTIFFVTHPYTITVIGDNNQPRFPDENLFEIPIPGYDPNSNEVVAVALNDAGQAAVNFSDYIRGVVAYRWSNWEGAVNLTPNASNSYATAMNEAGQVIGVLTQDGVDQAFVTRRFNTSLLMLGRPGDGNQPTGINDFGVIVGTVNNASQSHAYVTTPWNVHRHIDLSTLNEVTRDGWSEIRPVAINNRGQIAGTGKIDGNDRAFLLTPKSLLAFIPDRNGAHAKCYR